jgi:hypothetical protein
MKAMVKMDGNFLRVFGVGKLGHEPFVTLTVSWSILSF